MPAGKFTSLTIPVLVYEKLSRKAEVEERKVGPYAADIIMSVLEADEALSRYAPMIEVFGLDDDCVILRDHKQDRILEVVLRDKDLYCRLDDSLDCVHVLFCQALPQVSRLVRR